MAKVSNVTPERYPEIARARDRGVGGVDPETVARVLSSYEDVKREAGRMDMEDVLLLTVGMLSEDERVAAQVRRQYKWFVVDEFQDVSPLQHALLDLWLGGRDEICVVGDPAQTIYSFAGANADYLRDFGQRHEGTTSIELVRNYRSTPQIVEAATKLLAGTASAGVALRSQSESGPTVSLTSYADEVAEATGAADRLRDLHRRGTPWAEMAVLFRINAQSEAFEEALSSAGVPYQVRGAARFFDRPEVREAITRLRGAARAGEATDDLVADVGAVLTGIGWSEAPPPGRGQQRDRWESWQALVDQAREFDGGFDAFVDHLDRRAAEQHAPSANGVTLATVHAAKGLEWDAVLVCGLVDGTFPIVHAESAAEIEEERRLLYVAMTRARRELECSWARARNPGGRASRNASRFLDPLWPPTQRDDPGARRQSRNRRAANCRECGRPLLTGPEKKRQRCSDCPASYDEELFERLREWRKERAATESVPAFVVFTDATLQLLAEHRPTTRPGLLRINGIGAAKVDRYGEDLMEILA